MKARNDDGKPKREMAIVGLGKMGHGVALHALERGIRVAGFDVAGAPDELVRAGLVRASRLTELTDVLSPPRAVFLYVPAGPPVDAVIDELAAHLAPGDVIVDAGNSYWGDSIRRHGRLKDRALGFVDLGTSGGLQGARHGACFMAGGDDDAVERIESLLLELAVPWGYVHAGPPGAGHFTKLVHNGIEFGMLQALGEGIDLLEHYKDRLDVARLLRCWQHGSVVRSWLLDLLAGGYDGGLDRIPPYVEDTGEVNWLVGDALRFEVPIPVIAQAVMALLESRDEKRSWARAIAVMRHGFGGHPYGKDAGIARERREGRIGDCP